ncbi:MAG: hypothetical protein ABSC93_24630 [Bryobacteraceae bacterium]
MLLVGLPVLGLLGILDAGRSLRAPLSITGEWTVELDAGARCAAGPASPRQPALSISQSGSQATIALYDGHAAMFEATVEGTALTAGPLSATIAGQPGARTLEGTLNLEGCGPVAFRAVRQTAKKGGT